MGMVPPVPAVGSAQYLLEAFYQLRFATADSMSGGLVPQSWSEVRHFAEATRLVSEPWELVVLFDMSWGYVNEFQKSSDAFRISPMERS
jgi:hypothetical protein